METNARKAINVVAGLVFKADRLLVCQRHENSAFALKWEFPGGKVESGESDAAALRRELAEELGIVVQGMRPIFQDQHGYPDGPEVSLHFFKILAYDGEPKNLVFQRIEWVELSQLEGFDFLEGDRRLISKLTSIDGAAMLE
jgi:8-oxo-dGTP diphosphatase